LRFFNSYLFVLGLLTSPFASAEVMLFMQNDGKSCHDYQMEIVGDINLSMVEGYQRTLARIAERTQLDCSQTNIPTALNSNGGDVRAALTLGRLFRDKNAFAIVRIDSECISACVFLLAGATRRLVVGKVGIHRPYFSELDSGMSFQEVRALRDDLNESIASYFRDVDIPSDLLDEMLSVRPEEVHYLTSAELTRFRLNQMDPTSDELNTARVAEELGITSAELRERKARVLAQCSGFFPNLPEYFECSNRIMGY
jgi:hypothetical protein